MVIHVEGFGLVLLNKTCRLCLRCDTLVAHKAELDKVLTRPVGADEPEYVVLGTISRQVYRRGMSGRASLDDVKDQMADFKSYWKVDFTPGGLVSKGPTDWLTTNIWTPPGCQQGLHDRRIDQDRMQSYIRPVVE
ncbi:MAG: hypothetical protein ABW292_03545 [Vicinamibacterales bacterium]